MNNKGIYMNNAGKCQKQGEDKQKCWKMSEGEGRQVEAMEEGQKLWKRVKEASPGLEGNSMLHQSINQA